MKQTLLFIAPNTSRSTFSRLSLFTVCALLFCGMVSSQTLSGDAVDKSIGHERFEISIKLGYSKPQMEAWGNDAEYSLTQGTVTVGGNRIVNSSNLAMNYGFGIQVFGKYSIIKSGIIKGILNLGFNQLESIYPIPNDSWGFGIRMPVFSMGLGLELNPFGTKTFYPSIFGVYRLNEIGGETFHFAGLDFFVVAPRFGYVYGINFNYRVGKHVALSLGSSFSYDNWQNKQTNDATLDDPHAIYFRDQSDATNGLQSARRIGYISFMGGVNFYFK